MDRRPVIILDFGSQYVQLIARRVRELGRYCEIRRHDTPASVLVGLRPTAIILSGGPSSVYDAGAPTVDVGVFRMGIPVLGICYGMQLMMHVLGGRVSPSPLREYGPAKLTFSVPVVGPLGRGPHDVWMSHGDHVDALPMGFEVLGTTPSTPAAMVGDRERQLFGVQFHPEVSHTTHGTLLLDGFLGDIPRNWTPESFAQEAIEKVRLQAGDASRLVCGISGGVDSSVAAAICGRAVGDRLTCVFVDNGLLRKDERRKVEESLGRHLGLDLRVVDASERFLTALSGISDPEAKRKIIGLVFIEVFEEVAGTIPGADYLVQGTLYPDVVESVSSHGAGVTIKSHHNVGGLPDRMNLKLCEPLRNLFKDEVRAAGRVLGLPSELVDRHPFPGPGLAVRCLGEITEPRLETLRQADAIFEEEIRRAGLYGEIWQSLAALLPVRSVGVMGDGRTYDEIISLRAVTSVDGMTADWFRMPHAVLEAAASRIVNEVRGVNRVLYDISSKPPATIEYE